MSMRTVNRSDRMAADMGHRVRGGVRCFAGYLLPQNVCY